MNPLPRNARLFIAFRVLFNARFYYPVLAVMFVDLGLTLDQYTLLNVAWAVSIVLCELPLGALGDQIGRRPLIVGAAALMVVEMAVLAFAPLGDPTLLFWLFLGNRVLSGLAEAAASGADEALAYDSMVDADRQGDWPRVLSRLGRRMSVAFIASMIVGGLVYDPDVMNGAARLLGFDGELDQRATARFPVYLTLLLSLGALAVAVAMREPASAEKGEADLAGNVKSIADAAAWIRRTRFVLALILFSLVLDTGVRVFLTFTSTYYRLIGIPAAWFGVLGAGLGALGFVAPTFAERLVEKCRAFVNLALVVGLTLAGLAGIALVDAWWGAFFIVPLGFGMHFLGYFLSHYLNEATESKRRATILSFKSLANNVAYGAAGWAFALLMRAAAGGASPPPNSPAETDAFRESVYALPLGVALAAAPLLLWATRIRRMKQREIETCAD